MKYIKLVMLTRILGNLLWKATLILMYFDSANTYSGGLHVSGIMPTTNDAILHSVLYTLSSTTLMFYC